MKFVISKEVRWKGYSKNKCTCGHYPKDHVCREGQCKECACTWYYPRNKKVKK